MTDLRYFIVDAFTDRPFAGNPAAGYPLAVFIRTGGGGDRPMIDRGPHAIAGGMGMEFRADMMPKLAQLASWRKAHGYKWRLEVDGGVDLRTARDCHAAGADTFVAGTSFFKATDRVAFLKEIEGLPGLAARNAER